MAGEKPFSVVTLDNIAGGALREQFDAAWEELIANIRDPNTDAEEVREINIKVRVAPDKNRAKFATRVRVTTKLSGLQPMADTLYLGKDEEGRIRPFTFDQKQADMFQEERTPPADVLPITQTAAGAR